jgi:hypothetical protein
MEGVPFAGGYGGTEPAGLKLKKRIEKLINYTLKKAATLSSWQPMV